MFTRNLKVTKEKHRENIKKNRVDNAITIRQGAKLFHQIIH